MIRGAIGLLIVALFLMACSSNEPSEPGEPPAATPEASQDDQAADADDADDADALTPTAVPQQTLADDDVTTVTNMEAGDQVEDVHGNLIVIYGVVEWPRAFDALSDAAHTDFPFSGDAADVADPQSELVALDVGMCAAGLSATGFGTAEFFVHESLNERLSNDPILGREVLARHPLVRPAFEFPPPAVCSRGWLPVVLSGEQAPTVARYVLTARNSASADLERHVYQWGLRDLGADALSTATSSEADTLDEPFTAGQKVTFNQGLLDDTTVVVDGWSELVGVGSPIDGTRLVAVSVNICPASQRLPEFGLGVDGWNIVAPVGGELLDALDAADPAASCMQGWVEFAVPFGVVPTAFFVTDGVNATTGYAEWTLVTAALPAPQ